jgi:hypothetical protein
VIGGVGVVLLELVKGKDESFDESIVDI